MAYYCNTNNNITCITITLQGTDQELGAHHNAGHYTHVAKRLLLLNCIKGKHKGFYSAMRHSASLAFADVG